MTENQKMIQKCLVGLVREAYFEIYHEIKKTKFQKMLTMDDLFYL